MRGIKKGSILLLLVGVLLSGCYGKAASESGNNAKQTDSGETPILKIVTGGDTWNPDNAFVPIIEKATNTDLEIQMVQEDEYDNKRNLLMASGDLPNVIRIRYQDPMYQKYVDEGMLLPLDEYYDKYPDVRKAFSPQHLELIRNEKDGKIYSVPRIMGLFPNVFMFRKDMLDKYQIGVPKTVDELKNAFKVLKEKMGGDFTPFVGNRNDLTDIDPFLNAFGVGIMQWIPSKSEPDKIVLSNTTEQFKQALIFMRDLRNEGLFEQQWLVGKERGIDKFYTGKAAFTMDVPHYIEYRTGPVTQTDPHAEIAFISTLAGPDGQAGGPFVTRSNLDIATAVVKGTKPEQIDAYFRLISWLYTDGYDLMRYGVEGQNFDVVGGKKVRRDREANPPAPEYDMENMDRFEILNPPKFYEFNRDFVSPNVPDLMFNNAKSAIEEANKTAIDNLLVNINDPVIFDNLNKIQSDVEEVISKIVLNPKSDADKVFEDYLNKLKQNKLDELTEAVNKLNDVK